VDGEQKLFRSNTGGFEEFQVNVTAGFHVFKWQYYKDFSLSEGDDQALIEVPPQSFPGAAILSFSCAADDRDRGNGLGG
jgi:hypothetical protein